MELKNKNKVSFNEKLYIYFCITLEFEIAPTLTLKVSSWGSIFLFCKYKVKVTLRL